MEKILSRHQAIIMSSIFAAVMGLLLLEHLPISLYPNVQKTAVRAKVFFKHDVEAFMDVWGKKIETSLKVVENAKEIEVIYSSGQASFDIEFEWNTDNTQALRDVTSVISYYAGQLDKDLPPPSVDIYNPGSESYVAVQATEVPVETLSRHLENNLIPKLAQMDGVSNSYLTRIGQRSVTISVDPYALIQHDLDITDIETAIKNSEFNKFVGKYRVDRRGKSIVQMNQKFTSIAQLSHLVVGSKQHVPIYLKDVAKVQHEVDDLTRVLKLNDDDTIAVAIAPFPKANLYKVSNAFVSKVRQATAGMGKVIILNHPSIFIWEAIETVLYALLIGMLVSSLLVLVFFSSLKKTFITCLIMPFSLAISIVLMKVFDVGVNLLSLGAMSISIGMAIDAGIVVIDSISRKMAEQSACHSDKFSIIVSALEQVKGSIIFAALTTVLVFAPLLFTAPLVSLSLRDLSIVVISIISASTFISLVLLPSLYIVLFGNKRRHIAQQASAPKVGLLVKLYSYFIIFFLNRRSVGRTALAALFVLSLFPITLVTELKKEIIAMPKATIVDVSVEFKRDSVSILAKEQMLKSIREQMALNVSDYVKFYYTDIRANVAYISAHLTHFEHSDYVLETLRSTIHSNDDYSISIEPWVTSKFPVPEYPDYRLIINGDSKQARRENMRTLVRRLRDEGFAKRVIERPKLIQAEQLLIEYDEQWAAKVFSGADLIEIRKDILTYLDLLFEKKFKAYIELNNLETPIFLELKHNEQTQLDDILNVPLELEGRIIYLRNFITVTKDLGWRYYYSKNNQEIFLLDVWLNKGVNAKDLLQLAHNPRSSKQTLFSILDDNREVEESVSSLIFALTTSVILIFILLLFKYRSIAQTLVVCSAIPIGISGAVLSLYLFDSNISMNSMIAIIMLCGICVNSSIIFIDFYNYASKTQDTDTAIVQAAQSRVNPILVTSLTTLLGMLPLAIGAGSGGDILKPLGIAMSGGMIFSTLIILFILPIMAKEILSN